jgi:hypothetical protein
MAHKKSKNLFAGKFSSENMSIIDKLYGYINECNGRQG